MKRIAFLGLSAAAVGLSGCVTLPHNEGAPAPISAVVSSIKSDLEAYQNYDAAASLEPPLNDACHGVVGFAIESVKVSLTTMVDDSVTGNGSAVLPVPGATFGPSMSATRDVKGTQTLTFALYPKPELSKAEVLAAQRIDAEKYPIAAHLKALREGLLDASRAKPCMSLVPPAGADGKVNDPGGTFAFGFTVTNQATAGGTLKLVIYSLGASGTSQSQFGNMVTVTFKAHKDAVALTAQ